LAGQIRDLAMTVLVQGPRAVSARVRGARNDGVFCVIARPQAVAIHDTRLHGSPRFARDDGSRFVCAIGLDAAGCNDMSIF
jgi:hypothetical protein